MNLKTICTIIIIFCISLGYSQERPSFEISFDGPKWLEDFQEHHALQWFNSPYSLSGENEKLLWRENGIEKGALLFDGYSTYMELEEFPASAEFSLSFWVAPRAYDTAPDEKISAILDHTDVENKSGYRLGILKHGNLVLEYGIGKEFKRLENSDQLLNKNKWNFVLLNKNELGFQVYLNGEKTISEDKGSKDNYLAVNNTSLYIGRHKDASGFGEKFKFNNFAGLLDEIAFYNSALSKDDLTTKLQNASKTNTDVAFKDIRLDHTKYYKDDPYRPGYHALAPAHWMNEPHAPLYYNGKYHLFYQHNPFGPYWGQIHWGHWVSDDMVNWKHTYIALAPEKGDLDPDGIWSGSAFIGPDNQPIIYYTAGNWSKEQDQYVSTAEPKNLNDPNLIEWDKTGVIIDKPEEYLLNEFRDPFVFKVKETYYMIVGSGIENKGGSAPLFRSKNAKDWEYLHPFYLSDVKEYPYLGGVWELPVFLPLFTEDGKTTEKYIFMVLPLRQEADVDVFYWIGEFDEKEEKFKADFKEPKLIDYGDFGFTGPSGFVDEKTNRTIVFTIAQGKYGKMDTYDMGWAHNAGLPMEMYLDENEELLIKPIAEIKKLRKEKLISCTDCSLKEVNEKLKNLAGDQLEINLEFENSEGNYGIEIRKSANGLGKGSIIYNSEKQAVIFDKENSIGEEQEPVEAPLKLNERNLSLNIFLDKSMIEIYCNEEVSITNRIYPKDKNANGLELIGPENLKIKEIEIWSMKNIDWKYVEDE